MIPLYGFLEGDTIGLLILAEGSETIRSVRERLKDSAAVRVVRQANGLVVFRGKSLSLDTTIETSGLQALDRFDVRWSDG